MSSEKIKKLEKTRKEVISKLLKIKKMLRGSYCQINTKCGKNNCWCKDGPGHSHSRISWSENGHVITRKVPSMDIEWVKEVTKNYKEYRGMRKELMLIETEVKKYIDSREKNIVKEARRGKSYLEVELHKL